MQESIAHRNGRWFFTLALTALGIVLAVFVLPRLIGYFIPFVIGWIIALITAPLVRLLEKKLHIRKKFVSVIVIVLVLGVIVGLLWLFIATLVREVIDFIPRVPGYMNGLMEVAGKLRTWLEGVASGLPENVREPVAGFLDTAKDKIVTWATSFSTGLAGRLGSVALSVPVALFYLIVTVVCSFLLVMEREKLWKTFFEAMPAEVRRFLDMGKASLKKALSGYFVAQIKMSWIIAIIILIGMLLLRVPYALLISLLIAFVVFLPVFGSGTILWPWAVVEIASGRYWTALWLMVIYAAVQIVRNVLSPKIMGDTMGLPPLLTLLFIYIGFKAYGIGGMIFAIPIGMVVVEVCQYGVFSPALGVLREMAAAIRALLKKPAAEEKAAPEEKEEAAAPEGAEADPEKTEAAPEKEEAKAPAAPEKKEAEEKAAPEKA